MTFALCAGCRHRFPVDSLSTADFSDQVGWHFDKLHSLLRTIEPHTSAEKNVLNQVQVSLQELCAMMQEESRSLHARLQANEELKTYSTITHAPPPPPSPSKNNTRYTCEQNKINAEQTNISSPQEELYTTSSKYNNNNSTANNDQFNRTVVTVTTQSTVKTNANQEKSNYEIDKIGSSIPAKASLQSSPSLTAALTQSVAQPFASRKLNSALELVSASIYNILQSVAVLTRADSAVLWLKPRGFMSNELVGPFAFGKAAPALDAVLCTAPYHVKDGSLPCVVASTGIALNMQPCITNHTHKNENESARGIKENGDEFHNKNVDSSQRRDNYKYKKESSKRVNLEEQHCARHDAHHVRGVALSEMTLLELMEYGEVAQLLVPIFSRYRSDVHEVKAILHLIGSTNFPFPFSKRNEVTVLHAAQLLAMMLSSYSETMLSEWTNHFYDPSVLASTGVYSSELDVRSDAKCMDDFTEPPLLIYRGNASYGANGVEERDFAKGMKGIMTKNAVPAQPIVGMRDLYRHVTNVENYWASSVKCNTEMEKMMNTLQEQLIKTEVHKLQQNELLNNSLHTNSCDVTPRQSSEFLRTNGKPRESAAVTDHDTTLSQENVKLTEVKKLETKLEQESNNKTNIEAAHSTSVRTERENKSGECGGGSRSSEKFDYESYKEQHTKVNEQSAATAAETVTTTSSVLAVAGEKAAAKRDSQVSSDLSTEVKLTSPVKAEGDINILLSTAPVLKPEEVEQLEGMVRKRLETMNSALTSFKSFELPSEEENEQQIW